MVKVVLLIKYFEQLINWFGITFLGWWKGLRQVAVENTEKVKNKTIPETDKYGRKLKRLWDSKVRGTNRKTVRKIGRNENCACGKMRTAPRDVTKRNKYKWCCYK